jgi:predicted MFS family arabinose efflux permease
MLPILEENGLEPKQAAGVAALFGIFAMIGKLVCGALVNRIGGQLLAAAVIAIAVPGYLIIITPGQPALLLAVAVALLGTSAGGQLHMLVYLTTRHFGMRAFGSIFGFIGSAVIIAGGAGPLVAGRLYDYAGNYQVMLMVGIPMAVTGTLLLLWLGDYPEARAARRMTRASA